MTCGGMTAGDRYRPTRRGPYRHQPGRRVTRLCATKGSARSPHAGDRALEVETANCDRLLPQPTTGGPDESDETRAEQEQRGGLRDGDGGAGRVERDVIDESIIGHISFSER